MGKSKGINIGYNPESGEFEDMDKQYEDDAYQYDEWKKSPEYIDMVNIEFARHKPKYSEADIDNALVAARKIAIDVFFFIYFFN